MVVRNKQLGNLGEETATEYLKKQGYKILERNFQYKKYGEMDIIAKKQKTIHFIEVKTRLRQGYGGQSRENNIYNPEDNITYFKQKQLIKIAKIYIAQKKLLDNPWQIDVIAIEINPLTDASNLRYIEQAIEDFD